jgi:lysophospholipase L1-like esterase
MIPLLIGLLFLVSAPSAPAGDQFAAPFLQANDVILFQGDSVTDGGRWRTGSDFNHIMGQDYGYILAAELGAAYPQLHLSFLNRGISGNRVVDLAARWRKDTLDLRPTILSILIGINDTLTSGNKTESVQEFEDIYNKLLAVTVAGLPYTKIILGEPFLLPVGKHKARYVAEISELKKRQRVVRRLADTYHLPFIPYQEAFDQACHQAPADYWSWDGVHPTYAGHALMTQAWLRAANASWAVRPGKQVSTSRIGLGSR